MNQDNACFLFSDGHGRGFARALEHRSFAATHGGINGGGLLACEREFQRVSMARLKSNALLLQIINVEPDIHRTVLRNKLGDVILHFHLNFHR